MIKDSTTRLVCDLAEGTTIDEMVEARTGMSHDELINDAADYNINNMTEAVQLFVDCAKAKNHIYIHTDYDGDGWGSAFILHELCKSIGANHDVYLPDRESDGYGMKESHAAKYLKPGDLLILADNGIAAHDAVNKAKEIGCKVLILDHHEGYIGPDGDILLPNADVVVDPHVTGGDFEDYCGAGLCYKFAEMFYETRCKAIREKWEPILKKMNSAAAISTITDSVSLTKDNRRIVRNGFECMSQGYLTDGLKAIMKELWMPTVRKITGDDIGFTLGPAINACGRLLPFGAKFFYDVSILDGPSASGPEFIKKVKRIKEVNESRKELTKKYSKEDVEQIENEGQANNTVIAVYRDGTVPGLDGIRAGRIAENNKAVAFAFSNDDSMPGVLKGSGRSAGGVDVFRLLNKLSHLILPNYGGHPAACGLKIQKDMLPVFLKEANKMIKREDMEIDNNAHYDKEIDWSEVPSTIDKLLELGPFGEGNPAPVFYIRNIPVEPGYVPKPSGPQDVPEPTYYMGKEKDSFCGITPNGIKVIGFGGIGTEYRDEGEPETISAIVTLGQDEKRGVVMPQIQISAFTMDIERNMERDARSADEECIS